MATTLRQVCCHDAKEGEDTLEVPTFLEVMLYVESAWVVSMMVRDVNCMWRQVGRRFCCNHWKKADPSCGGAKTDYKKL